jgi:WXG100 family type VII secretion target
MSASDEVAALPGGGALAALAAQVRGNPAAIRDVANRWSSAAGRCEAHAGSVKAAVGDVTQDWQGTSATAFAAFMGRFGAAGEAAEHALGAAARTLRGAAGALEEAQVSVESICENLLAEVAQLRRASPGATSSQLRPQIRCLTGEAADAARVKVAEAQQALASAQQALNGDLSRLGRTFSALPEAGTASFMHGWGQPNGWRIAPQAGPAATPGSGPGSGGGPAPSGSASPPAPPVPGGPGSGSLDGLPVSSGGTGQAVGGVPLPAPPHSTGPAAPAQVSGWINQAINVLQARGIPASKLSPADIWIIIQHESGGDPHAINNWDCVTLDTLILTRRGWLKHDEVGEADQTVGYNPWTGRSEWTPINQVVHYEHAPLIRIGHSRWHATVTPNHRWLSQPRGQQQNRGEKIPRWVATDAIRSRDRILLAAPADTVSRLEITVDEAAILGWIAGDGHVGTRKRRPTVSIAQSRPEMAERLRSLLKDVPHAVCAGGRGGRGPRHQFRLHHEYAQDLLRRSGWPEKDAVQIVLAMSAEQRAAWLGAVIDAAGTRSLRPGYARPRAVIHQAGGPLLDAIKLAVYLSGARPSAGILSGKDQWAPCFAVGINKPVVTSLFLCREDAGRGPAWCVKTELGSWTAEQNGHIFLTGNSNAAAGTPSIGIMQTIQPTFNSYALPGHGNIYNPVDNIIAGVRYALSRYGSLGSVPGVVAVRGGQPYVGY